MAKPWTLKEPDPARPKTAAFVTADELMEMLRHHEPQHYCAGMLPLPTTQSGVILNLADGESRW